MIRLKLQSYGQFNADHRVGPSVWPHFDLLCVHKGQISLSLLGESPLEMSAGDVVLIFPNTPFKGDAITAMAHASVHHFELIDVPNGAQLVDLADRQADYISFPGPRNTHFRRDVDRLIQLSQQPQLSHTYTMSSALLVLLVSQLRSDNEALSSPAATPVAQFDGLHEWVMDNLDKKLTITDLATHVGVSESHFRALFKRQENCTAGTFLGELRMTEAQRLLRETRMPIKRVARAVGYASSVSFYHAFTRCMAMTPAEYRERKAPRG